MKLKFVSFKIVGLVCGELGRHGGTIEVLISVILAATLTILLACVLGFLLVNKRKGF